MLKKYPISIKLPWHIYQKSLTINNKGLFLNSILFYWSLSFLLPVPHWVLYSCIVSFEIEMWVFQFCFWNCFGLFGFFVFLYNFQAQGQKKTKQKIPTGMLIQECVEPIDQFSKNAIILNLPICEVNVSVYLGLLSFSQEYFIVFIVQILCLLNLKYF